MIKDSTQDITLVKSSNHYLTSDTYRLLGNHGDLRKHSYHFVGIGGIGMSAIAQILRGQGHTVSGSDRNHDRKITPEIFQKLQSQGISLYPQNGSGIEQNTNFIVISSAIEDDNPDTRKAIALNRNIIKRADLLSEMFNANYGIAVGGTNGKTTVSSLIGYIMDCAGLSPTIIVGGCIKNYVNNTYLGNAKAGTSDIISIEADESDGSITLYKSRISVITNISKDHKTIGELSKLFTTFSEKTTDTLVINADCPNLKELNLRHKNVVTYGLNNDADINAKGIVCKPFLSTFNVNGKSFEINLPGIYNVHNALAAIAVAIGLKINDDVIAMSLKNFMGVQRRMDVIGEVNGIMVIDDFAHNPEKISAVINAVKLGCKRVIAIFQPHGYIPASFMKEEFINVFIKVLSSNDVLFMPEIYYAGGTTNKSISSAEFVSRIKEGGRNAFFVEDREDIIPEIKRLAHSGDCILVMGARDYTLTEFCHKILHSL